MPITKVAPLAILDVQFPGKVTKEKEFKKIPERKPRFDKLKLKK